MLFILLLALVIFGGIYMYASSNKEKLVLKANLEELAFQENLEMSKMTQETSGQMELFAPIAFGPEPIDDEKEDDFHGRWVWLLAKAAAGELRRPRSMPIERWPPQFA